MAAILVAVPLAAVGASAVTSTATNEFPALAAPLFLAGPVGVGVARARVGAAIDALLVGILALVIAWLLAVALVWIGLAIECSDGCYT